MPAGTGMLDVLDVPLDVQVDGRTNGRSGEDVENEGFCLFLCEINI